MRSCSVRRIWAPSLCFKRNASYCTSSWRLKSHKGGGVQTVTLIWSLFQHPLTPIIDLLVLFFLLTSAGGLRQSLPEAVWSWFVPVAGALGPCFWWLVFDHSLFLGAKANHSMYTGCVAAFLFFFSWWDPQIAIKLLQGCMQLYMRLIYLPFKHGCCLTSAILMIVLLL